MHTKNNIKAGRELTSESKVLVMIHGRGGSAEDILTLAEYLNVKDFSLLAPQATGNTWYPYSFMAPPGQNEPWLSSALDNLKELVDDLLEKDIPSKNIFFMGFSQGACLTLEFVTRNARPYGGVAAFTGGLIGDKVYEENYQGDFENTPIFIGSSDPDPHVPVERVRSTENVLKAMNASVHVQLYPGMPHTISQDEINKVNQLIFTT